jgi:hypothetical protein
MFVFHAIQALAACIVQHLLCLLMLWRRCAYSRCAQEDPASSTDEEPSSQQQQQQRTPLQQPARPAAAAVAAAAKLQARVRRLQQLEATGQISSPFLADVVASKLQQVRPHTAHCMITRFFQFDGGARFGCMLCCHQCIAVCSIQAAALTAYMLAVRGPAPL